MSNLKNPTNIGILENNLSEFGQLNGDDNLRDTFLFNVTSSISITLTGLAEVISTPFEPFPSIVTEISLGEDRNENGTFDDDEFVATEEATSTSAEGIGENAIVEIDLEPGDYFIDVYNPTLADYTGDDLAEVVYLVDISSPITGTDNDDNLTGTDEDDIIDGLAGNDTMSGGNGNDTYYVDSKKDVVIEESDNGWDTVFAEVNYKLGNNVESLSLLGSKNRKATGNNLDNDIFGNEGRNQIKGKKGNDVLFGFSGKDNLFGDAGDDILAGNLGKDVLEGGKGSDLFFFDTPEEGGDKIKDFEVGVDSLAFTMENFEMENFADDLLDATLPKEQFVVNSKAKKGRHRFIYDSSTGDLFFDGDGKKGDPQVLMANFPDLPDLSHEDIFIFSANI